MKKKNSTYILLSLILVLGLFVRVIGINKPFGLEFDEALTFTCANNAFPFGILKNLLNTDIHMPLYFLILHIWIRIFGSGDMILRLLSVVFGEIAIIFGYLAGKEFKDKDTGLICVLLVAINSLAIYYSQEVRVYSLLFLASSILLWQFVRTIKNTDIKNICILLTSGLILIYTDTVGIFFFAIILLELFIYLWIKKDKKSIKNLILMSIYGQIFLIPFYLMIYKIMFIRKSIFPDVFFFDNQVIFGIIQNWFSPLLVGLNNNPQHYLIFLFSKISVSTVIFVLIPVVISILFILKNNFKKPENILISSAVILFILMELIGSYMKKVTILSRYTLFVLPFLILLISSGISEFKHKTLAKILFVSLILINLFYLFFIPGSAPRKPRFSGQRVPAVILKKYDIGKNDIVIFPIRTNLSDKYYPHQFRHISMLDIFDQLYPTGSLDKNGRYTFYKKAFLNANPPELKEYYNHEIYNKLKPGNKLVIAIQTDFEPYNDNIFNYILSNDKIYRSQPLLFMRLYKTSETLVKNSSILHLEKVYKIEHWIIIVYKK